MHNYIMWRIEVIFPMEKWKIVSLSIFGLVFSVAISSLFFFPAYVSAVDLKDQIDAQLSGTAARADVGAQVDPRVAVASIVQVFLTLLGTVFFILMIMSGYWLITARGDEEKEKKAKDTIRSAVIGLAIVLTAYAITVFVSARLQAAAGLGAGARRAQDPRCQSWFWRGFRSICP